MEPFVRRPGRLAAAAVVIGVTVGVDAWVATYKTITPEGRVWLYGSPPRVSQAAFSRMYPHFFAAPGWVVPTAFGIAALGLVAAAGVLLTIRGRTA
jgi:hypothetical protein